MSAAVGSDAANILADALHQMDGLISSANHTDYLIDTGPCTKRVEMPGDDVLKLLEELKAAVESNPFAVMPNEVPHGTARYLSEWINALCQTQSQGRVVGSAGELEASKRMVSKLEGEKDSLILQVSVLTDQVEAQGEKIHDLEINAKELEAQLEEKERSLRQEKAHSLSLESEIADLQSEVSLLKFEKDEHGLSQMLLAEKEVEIERLSHQLEELNTEVEQRRYSQSSDGGGSGFSTLRRQIREKASELTRLKIQSESLTASNAEKDKRIVELEEMLMRFKKVEDILLHKAKTVTPSSSASINGFHSGSLSEDYPTLSQSEGSPTPPITPTMLSGPEDTMQDSYRQAVQPIAPPRTSKTMKQPDYKCSSEPNLAMTERDSSCQTSSTITPNNGYTSSKDTMDLEKHKVKRGGLRKSFGKAFSKLKKSRSHGGLPDELQNGGEDYLRQQRLEQWRVEQNCEQPDIPFTLWDTGRVLFWLEDIGLAQYVPVCKHFIKSGQDLLKANSAVLEKELGFKHPLHRKKLLLALQSVTSDTPDLMGKLDNNWVLSWLEDIGLPQYKDTFNSAIVDGRMLHYLTMDDLYLMKVYNAFHHISIKRAIQCLRLHNFHPNCLKRYPIDERWQNGADVLLWTSGRVMEWLRLVDLAEYAPNLRGSGVHGSLMMLEPRFNAETLANLLSIPTNKTLLRRHLGTHFSSLIGQDCQEVKRECEQAHGYVPMVSGGKPMKMQKKSSLGSIRKRSRSESEPNDYICPMDLEIPSKLQSLITQRLRRHSDRVRSETDKHAKYSTKQMMDDMEGIDSPPSLGAFSQELDSLTNMLNSEEHYPRERKTSDL